MFVFHALFASSLMPYLRRLYPSGYKTINLSEKERDGNHKFQQRRSMATASVPSLLRSLHKNGRDARGSVTLDGIYGQSRSGRLTRRTTSRLEHMTCENFPTRHKSSINLPLFCDFFWNIR